MLRILKLWRNSIMISISIEEEIKNLMLEGWGREQAMLRTSIALELRKGGKDLDTPHYENRYREKMHKYRR